MSFDLRDRRTTFAYGVASDSYAKGYHRGLDKGADPQEIVQWAVSGVVTQITRNNAIGTWVETTNESGVGGPFIAYGHTRAPAGLRVGERVGAGRDGPIVNGWGDDHGNVWQGPHVHLWNGSRSGDIGNAYGTDEDPAPILARTSTASGDITPYPEKPKPTGVPMFNLISVPDAGLIFVQGIDGRREGIQSAAHLIALRQYRDAMLTPGPELVMYFGDLVGQRGSIDWYLARVNGPRPTAEHPASTPPAPYKFTEAELASIGVSARVDLAPLVAQIAALDKQADGYQAELEALLLAVTDRSYTLTPVKS